MITIDADMQDSPDEIPGLRSMLLEGNYDLVSGWKKVRYDNTFTKNIPSKFFNISFQDFKDNVCRDTRFSPYAAIVIDPFTNLSSNKMPADGGYPGLTSYYVQFNRFSTNTGSTGTEIEDISINNFFVGICS